MQEKKLVLITAIILSIIFLTTNIYIKNIKESKILLPQKPLTKNLLQIIKEKYNFQGTWSDSTKKISDTIPSFQNYEGICFLKIYEKVTIDDIMDMYFNDDKNKTSFILEVTLFDNFSLSGKKLKLKEIFKEEDIIGNKKNFIFNTKNLKTQNSDVCNFEYGFFIKDDKFLKTRFLEDLEIDINFKSNDKRCLMNINANFKYNYERNISILKFSSMSILLGIFELILISYIIFKLNRTEFISKYQSIIFWIGMAMCNSLFFFMNIFISFFQNGTSLYVFIGAFINFINLYLIILKVLHKIGLINFLSMNDTSPQEARRFIATMHIKIYIIILLGMLFGMQNFPNFFLIFSIPIFFFTQIFYISYVNDRLFPPIIIHFALAFSKILFCLYSKRTVFFNKYIKDENFNNIYLSILFLICGLLINQLQKKLGPRFILNKFFNKKNHEYFIPYEDVRKYLKERDECPICLGSLKENIDFDETVIPDLYEQLIYMGKLRDNIIMKTPCNHFYHIGCLVSTMHYKKRCAVCREDLPNWY